MKKAIITLLMFIIIIACICVIGVCNDDTTFVQVVTTVIIGITVIVTATIALSLVEKQRFMLEFYDDQGRRRTTKPLTILGKGIALIVAKKCGYKISQELSWEEGGNS